MSYETSCFDVAVIGGGPAGSAAAIGLSQLGHNVILLDKSITVSPKVGEILPPSAKPFLNMLGVWTTFKEIGSIPSYGAMSAWGGNVLLSNSFIFSPYVLGWHIDRQLFDDMLIQCAIKQGTVVLTDSYVTQLVSKMDAGWLLEFQAKSEDNGRFAVRSICAKVIINATGRTSNLFQKLGSRQIIYDSLVGLGVRFKAPAGYTGPFILTEATEFGWWYSAEIPGGEFMVVFMTDADIAVKKELLKLEEWMKNLEKSEHTKERVHDFTPLWGPRIFSASSRMLRRSTYNDRWLAVGDAMMAVDPLSSKGILFALRSGLNAVDVVDRVRSGDYSSIENYHKKVYNEFTQYLSDRNNIYSLEKRWTNSTFWKRRSVLKNYINE